MHLLNVKTRKLETFLAGNVPRYAILSHTWGADEATFGDFKGGRGTIANRWPIRGPSRRRTRFSKIGGCCERAASEGFRYVWIDTCSIDKTSSSELSEAINSMYKWYAGAAVCYIYLSDIRCTSRRRGEEGQPRPDGWRKTAVLEAVPGLEPSLVDDLRRARWFTRGWTLQELLAPGYLKFFDSDWNILGTSGSAHGDGIRSASDGPELAPLLADITGIPSRYLRSGGAALSSASVAERMSWGAGRQTTRAEDRAYCLLGLFNVSMPMLYGEGEGAFERLQDEIMKKYDDHSIFAWGMGLAGEDSTGPEFVPGTCVANSPDDFRGSAGMVVRRPAEVEGDGPLSSYHYVMTNTGMNIELPLVQLQSGEFLARLNCTVDDDNEPGIFLQDKYLCLVLIQSRDRNRVYYRSRASIPNLVPAKHFRHVVPSGLYLAPVPPIAVHKMAKTAPLFVSKSCSRYFTVRQAHPAVLDPLSGLYVLISDLWSHLRQGKCIFLDCITREGRAFAIRVGFYCKLETEPDSEETLAVKEMRLSTFRDRYSMAELMMPGLDDSELGWEESKISVFDEWLVELEPADESQWQIMVREKLGDGIEQDGNLTC